MAFEHNFDHDASQSYSEGDPIHLAKENLAIQQCHYLSLWTTYQIILGLLTSIRNFGTEADENCHSKKTRYLNVVMHLEKYLILVEGILHPFLASMDKHWARIFDVQVPFSWPASEGCFRYLLLMGPNYHNYYQETLVNLKIHIMDRVKSDHLKT